MGANVSRGVYMMVYNPLIIAIPCASIATIAAHVHAMSTRDKLVGETIPVQKQICQLVGTLAGVATIAVITAQLGTVLTPLVARGFITFAAIVTAFSQTRHQLVFGYDTRNYTDAEIASMDTVPPTEVAVFTTSLSAAAWESMTYVTMCTTLYMGVNWGVNGALIGPFVIR